jgi:hypothetical protein
MCNGTSWQIIRVDGVVKLIGFHFLITNHFFKIMWHDRHTFITRQRLGKQVFADINVRNNIWEMFSMWSAPRLFLCNRAVKAPPQQEISCVFCVVRAEGLPKGQRRWSESVEFRDASLPQYELGSRGIEASELLSAVQCSWKSSCEEKTLWVLQYRYTWSVPLGWDCYSFCVKIRYQETTSGECK